MDYTVGDANFQPARILATNSRCVKKRKETVTFCLHLFSVRHFGLVESGNYQTNYKRENQGKMLDDLRFTIRLLS